MAAIAEFPKTSYHDEIPFDLERAMAGEPVCTRDGRRFQFVAHHPDAEDRCERVEFRGFRGTRLLVSEQGRYLRTGFGSESDLYMAEPWTPSRAECKAFALAAGVPEAVIAESHITLARYAIMHCAVAGSAVSA